VPLGTSPNPTGFARTFSSAASWSRTPLRDSAGSAPERPFEADFSGGHSLRAQPGARGTSGRAAARSWSSPRAWGRAPAPGDHGAGRRRGIPSRWLRAAGSTTSPIPSITRGWPATSTEGAAAAGGILESCRPPALLLLLDGSRTRRTSGALIRSAEAVGATRDRAGAPGRRATPAAVKASAAPASTSPSSASPTLPRLWPDRGGRDLARRPGCEADVRYDLVDYREPRRSSSRGGGGVAPAHPPELRPPCLAAHGGPGGLPQRGGGGCGHPVRGIPPAGLRVPMSRVVVDGTTSCTRGPSWPGRCAPRAWRRLAGA